MADLDPQLSPHLCAALSVALGADWGQALVCVDVSAQQLEWDIEARDRGGEVVVKVSHTRALWQELRKAEPEMEDIRLALENTLAHEGLSDLVVSLHFQESPKSKARRRQLAEGLALHVRLAAGRLQDAPLGACVDVLRMAEEARDPRTLDLYSMLNKFDVHKIGLGGPALVLASDIRFMRWMPPLASVVMPRLKAKAKRHDSRAGELVLLIEVEASDVSVRGLEELAASVPEELRVFQALYLCDRNPGLKYTVSRVY